MREKPRPARLRPRHFAWGAAFAFLVILVLLLAWLPAFDEREVGRYRLADGSTLVIEAITYGPREHVQGAWWQRLLYHLLPADQKHRAGVEVYRGGDGLAVHWRTLGGAGPGLVVALADDGGNRVVSNSLAVGSEERGVTYTSSFVAFPRRARELHCTFYQDLGAEWRQVARFRFPTPDSGSHPRWQSAPLPVQSRDGPLTVTLREFRAIAPPPWADNDGPLPGVWSLAVLQLTESGRATRAWKPYLVGFTDATGQQFGTVPESEWKGDLLHLYLETTHAVTDDVWELAFAFEPANGSSSPREVGTLPGIPIPARSETVALNRKIVLRGVELEALGIYGKGAPLPPRFDRPSDPERVALAVRETRPKASPFGVFAETKLQLHASGWRDNAPDTLGLTEDDLTIDHLFSFAPPDGLREVTARFVVSSLATVKFLAARKPQQ